MKFKIAFLLLLGAFLLGGIAYFVNLPIVNMICYTLASFMIIGSMVTAIGPKNFIIFLIAYLAIVALYLLAIHLVPSNGVPFK
jgi:hypothetical protein